MTRTTIRSINGEGVVTSFEISVSISERTIRSVYVTAHRVTNDMGCRVIQNIDTNSTVAFDVTAIGVRSLNEFEVSSNRITINSGFENEAVRTTEFVRNGKCVSVVSISSNNISSRSGHIG